MPSPRFINRQTNKQARTYRLHHTWRLGSARPDIKSFEFQIINAHILLFCHCDKLSGNKPHQRSAKRQKALANNPKGEGHRPRSASGWGSNLRYLSHIDIELP